MLGGQRQRCVLAVLLLNPGRVIPVERIIACAWPSEPPDTAAELVTSYISRLRKQLDRAPGQIALVSRRPGYLAQVDPEHIDVHKFARLRAQAGRERASFETEASAAHLREALNLWRGIPLADLDSPYFNEQRTKIEQARLYAVEDLAEIELEADHGREIVGMLRDLIDAHPERERLTVLTVRALHAIGEPTQALDLVTRAVRARRRMGLEPSPQLQQAQQDALQPASAPKRTRAAVGRAQLPADTATFVGRRPELDSLITLVDKAQDAGTVMICAIDGMAGIGKTALAVHAAHRLAGYFPDGQLFIDLHGFTPDMDPITPDTALDRFLRALGVSAQQIPQGIEDRAALYRDRLANTRTLIVLDNAATQAQISPLLPGTPGCLVLITSRRRLTGLDDAQAIRLEILSDADAADLFTAIAGPGRASTGDPAVTETVALCGHMPLAIRIAAARLRNRSAWAPRHLVARLRDQTRRLTQLDDGERSLTAALALSFNHLTHQERRMFRYLGLHPGTDIDTYAAAALADLPVDTVDNLLERLVDHNLLAQPSTGRYQLHDLIRIYARTLAAASSEPDSRPLTRLQSYYLHVANEADDLLAPRAIARTQSIPHPPAYVPSLSEDEQATAWMEAERANLTATADHAFDHGPVSYAIAMTRAMNGFLRAQGHWQLAIRLQTSALKAAESIEDYQGQADALCSLGALRAATGQYEPATHNLDRALELYFSLGDELGEANAHSSLAHVYHLTAHFPQAVEALRRALTLYARLEDWKGQADALTTLGAVQKQTGQYQEAQNTLNEALRIYKQFGNRLGLAAALTDLGEVQQLAGRYAEAISTLEQAFGHYRGLNNRDGQADALTNLGEVLLLMGIASEAGQALSTALLHYRELGNQLGEANALRRLGAVHHAAGDHQEATSVLLHSLLIYEQLGNRLGQADAFTTLSEVQRALGHDAEAAQSHRRALELYSDIDSELTPPE